MALDNRPPKRTWGARLTAALQPVFKYTENKLEEAGELEKAQKLRNKQQGWLGATASLRKRARSLIENDIDLREIVQREAFLIEECQKLEK